jgi:hypothetical protein
MALTTTEMGLCNKLYGDYAAMVNPVKQAKSGIIGQKNSYMSMLSSLSWSPLENVMAAVQGVKDQVAIPYPLESAMYDIKRFLENCNYLGALSPASAVLGAAQNALYGVDSAADGYGNTVPEMSAAGLANKMDSLMQGLGIPGGSNLAALLTKADQILECMSALCAGADPTYNGQVANMANDMDGMFRDMYLRDDPGTTNHGTMDYDRMMNEINLDFEKQTNAEYARRGILDTKLDILSTTSETLSMVQQYTKIGFFS